MVKIPKNVADDERSPEETERIAEQTLKKPLSTPPKPRTKDGSGGKKNAKGSPLDESR